MHVLVQLQCINNTTQSSLGASATSVVNTARERERWQCLGQIKEQSVEGGVDMCHMYTDSTD